MKILCLTQRVCKKPQTPSVIEGSYLHEQGFAPCCVPCTALGGEQNDRSTTGKDVVMIAITGR
jgi:hypothetical protein